MKEFENRVTIVTGTTGIACAIAKRFASAGCSIVSCGIEPAANAELQDHGDEDEPCEPL